MDLRNEVAGTTAAETEDDGSVFVIENGTKKAIVQGEFIYPCSEVETYMSKVGILTVTTVWLESDWSLNLDDVRKALWIVSRQVPQLQFCLAKRENKVWFRRMKNFELDFELSSKDALEMHNEMLETMVDLLNGPLWKARLNIHHTSDQISSGRSKASCLSLCVHHVITDATSTMKILRELVFTLNKINLGQIITPKMLPTTGQFIYDRSFSTGYFVIKKSLINIFRVARWLIFMSPLKKSVFLPLLAPVPSPSSSSSKTKVIFKNFTSSDTEVILKLCKANRIIVNSFVITAANFAVMSIAQERKHKPIGPRKVTATQAVNLRRYYGPNYIDCSGNHVSYIEGNYKMASNSNFWDVAEQIHSDIKDRVANLKEPVKNLSLMKSNYNIIPLNKFLQSKINRRLTLFNYFATNMGNLNEKLPEPKENDSVEITNLLRSASHDEYDIAALIFTFQTFRGKLLISVDYNSNCLADETAKNFIDTFFKVVKSVSFSENNKN